MTVYVVTTGQSSDTSLAIDSAFSTREAAEAYIARKRQEHPQKWPRDRESFDWEYADVCELEVDAKSMITG